MFFKTKELLLVGCIIAISALLWWTPSINTSPQQPASVEQQPVPQTIETKPVERRPNRFWHESSTQFTDSDIAAFVKKYSKDILIGGDPGWGTAFEQAMRSTDDHGGLKHVYLMGPGMMSWSSEERTQIQSDARSIGIDVRQSGWHAKWFDWGWKKKQKEQFAEYAKQGFYSAEIDNIDGPIEQDDTQSLIKWYMELFDFLNKENLQIKLMVKNLNVAQLRAVIKAVDGGLIDKNRFAPFGMFEAGSGEPREQIKLASQLGIKAVTPISGLRETHNYGTTRAGIPALEPK